MERDALENRLKQQLHDYKVEPPQELWAAIEADLGKIYTKPAGKRLSLREHAMRYAVAATLLLAVVTFGLLYNPKPMEVADLLQQMPQPTTNTELARAEEQPIETESALVKKPRIVMSQHKPKSAETHVSLEAQKAITPVKIDVPQEKSTVAVGEKAPKQHNDDGTLQQKQAKAATAQWYNEVDRKPIKNRHRTRKSTSLYAANIATGSSNSSVNSPAKLAQSSFAVYEMSTSIENAPIGSISMMKGVEYRPESLRHHAPLSVGVSFSWAIARRFDIETGVAYTYLKSDADTKSNLFDYRQKQELHYLGIPVSVKYNFVDMKRLGVYIRGGAMVEKGIYGKLSTKITQSQEAVSDANGSTKLDIKGVQVSLSLGAGAEYKFTKALSLYVEPSMNYYFEGSDQPLSYRTENPLHFGLKAGVRVNFR